MLSTILLVILVGLTIKFLQYLRQFRSNLAQAKASGIPYVPVPFFLTSRIVMTISPLLAKLEKRLPDKYTFPWLSLSLEFAWKRRYEVFERVESDTFLSVSPTRITLCTADAAVVDQITSRRNDFPKSLEMYRMLKIYGPNVVCEEGQVWRHHRKITSPPFSEKNNILVWQESIKQTQLMLNTWFQEQSKETGTIRTLADDAMRFSLHVISRAGFDKSLEWPAVGEDARVHSTEELQDGHSMTYVAALETTLRLIILILLIPKWLLRKLPFETTKLAYQSYVEWGQYMKEMYDKKKAAVLAGTKSDQLDLMTAMVKGAGTSKETEGGVLKEDEVLGNAFVFLLAGHETTANSIHFSLVLLALNIASQRRLQKDLDETFQGRPPSQWNYDRDVPKLFNNMAGAVMNEELRLFAPVTMIPKCTMPESPQSLMVNGRRCTVPAHVSIGLITTAAHRNPRQWLNGPPRDPERPAHPLSNLDNDLEEFKPERWLLDTPEKRAAAQKIYTSVSGSSASQAETHNTDKTTSNPALGLGPDKIETSANVFKPPKGAFFPFSEGHRSCLGRRFAQVEILAVLAVIFSKYSVELAVDQWTNYEELAAMGTCQKREVWEKARNEVERQLVQDTNSRITLQLLRGHIPLRLVERGSERFNFAEQ